MKRYSHQRITKIKRDRIEDLLKRAEATKVEDACTVQPAGSDLTPYPDMNNLRNYTRDYLLKGLTKTYPVKFDVDGQTYLTTIIDGLPLFTKMSKTITGNIETSKPGLWLSNLSTPVYNSNSGGFLANNFIHNNESSFNTVNSDIIGNYAYTFTQRGVIHRVAGSSHYDQDSYNQMWSPSALSCISHEAIIIPELLLQQTYTTYQSMVVPADPDTQSYDEAKNKTVEYNFIDNNNNDPATTTAYNGRFVGVDWSYEFKFTPNGNGSGNNYGSGSDPYVDNGSNGGCIAGTIEYNLLVNGQYVTCTQTVNKCMQTGQSYFNSAVPDSNSELLNDSNMQTNTYRISAYTCCCSSIRITDGSYLYDGNYIAKVSGPGFYLTGGVTSSENVYLSYDISAHATCGIAGIVGVYNNSDCCLGWCGGTCAKGTLVTAKSGSLNPETGINIYLNMTDLKAQYEANGLPWTGDCNTSRFQFEFSTTKCTSPWCTSLVIAENVDINNLGDISKLNDVIFSK